MKLKAAFLFVAPEANHKVHKSTIDTPMIELTTIGVKNYTEAEEVAKELVNDGISAIELCAGFGNEGVSIVNKAVEGKAVVGVVRFDKHPGLDFQSGDSIFK